MVLWCYYSSIDVSTVALEILLFSYYYFEEGELSLLGGGECSCWGCLFVLYYSYSYYWRLYVILVNLSERVLKIFVLLVDRLILANLVFLLKLIISYAVILSRWSG
jgi:hypothetical protein